MSDYIKPQAPLYNEGHDEYVYPLTTASQVIDEETGHRLDVEGVFKRDILTLEEMQAVTGDLSKYAASAKSLFETANPEMTEFTPTKVISSGTYNDHICFKLGHLVFFYVYLGGLTGATNNVPLVKFQYKPKCRIQFIGAGRWDSGSFIPIIYEIRQDGNLTQQHATTSTNIVCVSGVYYTDD